VPISLVGEAEAVHREDGIVSQELFSLTVQATPGNIPNSIEVDISELKVGDTIRVGDLKLPEGVTLPELKLGKEHDLAVVIAKHAKEEVEEVVDPAVVAEVPATKAAKKDDK
jgi:large subunit ribosomal protein L25